MEQKIASHDLFVPNIWLETSKVFNLGSSLVFREHCRHLVMQGRQGVEVFRQAAGQALQGLELVCLDLLRGCQVTLDPAQRVPQDRNLRKKFLEKVCQHSVLK